MNRQVIFIASILLSIVTVIYGIVFSYQLGGNIFVGTLIAAMMLGFNILEFTMIYYIAIFINDKVLMPIIFGIFIVITGISFSVFSNIWVVSNSYNTYKSDRILQGQAYKAWLSKQNRLAEEITEIEKVYIPKNLTEQKDLLNNSITQALNKTAYNSQNQNTGKTVGDITNNCSLNNYYSGKYCKSINDLQKNSNELDALQQVVNKKKALIEAQEKHYQSTPTPTDSHAPGIVTITNITGLSGDKIISLINLLFALVNEIGAIFGWYILGYTKSRLTEKVTPNVPKIITPPLIGKIMENTENKQVSTTDKGTLEQPRQTIAEIMPSDMAEKLKQISHNLGYKSVNSFAKAINVPPATLSENMSGKRPPSIITLLKVKSVMPGFSIDKFLTGDK